MCRLLNSLKKHVQLQSWRHDANYFAYFVDQDTDRPYKIYSEALDFVKVPETNHMYTQSRRHDAKLSLKSNIPTETIKEDMAQRLVLSWKIRIVTETHTHAWTAKPFAFSEVQERHGTKHTSSSLCFDWIPWNREYHVHIQSREDISQRIWLSSLKTKKHARLTTRNSKNHINIQSRRHEISY